MKSREEILKRMSEGVSSSDKDLRGISRHFHRTEVLAAMSEFAAQYEERVKELEDATLEFMATIPITNHNYYLVGFTKALAKLKSLLPSPPSNT